MLDPELDSFALKSMKAKAKSGAIEVFKDPFQAVENWLSEREKKEKENA